MILCIVSMAALSLGLVFTGSCDDDIGSVMLQVGSVQSLDCLRFLLLLLLYPRAWQCCGDSVWLYLCFTATNVSYISEKS